MISQIFQFFLVLVIVEFFDVSSGVGFTKLDVSQSNQSGTADVTHLEKMFGLGTSISEHSSFSLPFFHLLIVSILPLKYQSEMTNPIIFSNAHMTSSR